MRKENEKTVAKNEERDAKMVDALSPEERYQKLTELLSKSKFYSEYLLTKMEDQARP